VAPLLDQSVATDIGTATAFLYTGTTPIQTGVAPGTIVRHRAALLRGRVLASDSSPLGGVRIAILNHAEFGQTLSRADGMFDIVVNGGGPLTVTYTRNGYLVAQRQAAVGWQATMVLPDVVLITSDVATAIDLTSSAPMQVARGSQVTDTDGTRRATLLFPQGMQASLVFPDETLQPVTHLTVRATEYTVGPNGPLAMPAELPERTAYTYAVELGADEADAAGATSIQYNQPVVFYLENFLRFPVGGNVPTGYYDRTRGTWVPSTNGRVLAITSIAGGRAALDITGDGIADDATALATLGITDAERDQLGALYPVGQQLWRVPIPHFSPWDCNWGWGPPAGATAPPSTPPTGGEDGPDDPHICPGSVVACESQVLGESVPITGTPFRLHYQSDRAPARLQARAMRIALAGSSIPPGLLGVELAIEIMGQQFSWHFDHVEPNQSWPFAWDGRDVYGRSVQGAQVATVRVGYTYDSVYDNVARFGAFQGIPITSSRTRQQVTLWAVHTPALWAWDPRGQQLGGWTLSANHAYDSVQHTLQLGTGDRRSAAAIGTIITRLAGTGSPGHEGDNGPALDALLNWPGDVATASNGDVYIADDGDIENQRVRRVRASDGVIETVAGGGSAPCPSPSSPCGDGGLATDAQLVAFTAIAVGPDGTLYIGENLRVRAVGPDGIIRTVAGTGLACPSATPACGDGGPATAATFRGIKNGIAIDLDGSIYITDAASSRIRRVAPDGIIATVAGTGQFGLSGDGGLATSARLNNPRGITVGPAGDLYIADTSNNRIRRVGLDGLIRTVVGSSSFARTPDPDGIPATQAHLFFPWDVAVASDGTLYFSEAGWRRIRVAGKDGLVRTLAGNATEGFSGDGGLAAAAELGGTVEGISLAPDGSLVIADRSNSAIRRVAPVFPDALSGDFFIPSADGSEVYVFDSAGRHLQTREARTGALRLSFGYDPDERLVTVTDADGNVTRIERDADGNPVAIVAPGDARTTLGLDANGWLRFVEDPAHERVEFTYTPDGLLSAMTNARQQSYAFTYDDAGRLQRDDDPAGGFQSLARTDDATSYTVTRNTAEGRMTSYRLEQLAAGGTRRVATFADGLARVTVKSTSGTETTTLADGRVVTRTEGPDPRFGMQAPATAMLKTETPQGLVSVTTETRDPVTIDPASLRVTSAGSQVTVNGLQYTRMYLDDGTSRTLTDGTPTGRTRTTTLDSRGRVASVTVSGLAPMSVTRDATGLVRAITVGTGQTARTATLDYDTRRRLGSIVDALQHQTVFGFDGSDRVTSQTFPDGSAVTFGYDPNGNVTSVTPPGRLAHALNYTPVDLEETYTPPTAAGSPETIYHYNHDRQLTQIARLDGRTVDFTYEPTGGRLNTRTSDGETVTFGYDPTHGQLTTLTSTSGENLAYTYDGSLVTGATWTGPVAGSVAASYDNFFRVQRTTVDGGQAVSLQYDPDSLLTQAGALTLSRDPQHGLVTGTTLGAVTDTRTYNAFGELATYTASPTGGGMPYLQTSYPVRDNLGRIVERDEAVLGGSTHITLYDYDLRGRLKTVTTDGTTVTYTYDDNGNRLTREVNGTVVEGNTTTDDQDRLLAHAGATYTYTANGEVASKTAGTLVTLYDYDALGNLRSVTLPNDTTIAYLIDPANRRVGKTVNGTLVQGFLYEGQLRVAAELDGSGNIVSRFVYGTRVNMPEYMVKNGATYRLLTDHLGSPRLVINGSDGSVVQRMEYDEFGRVTLDTNPGFQPFGFAGGLYDRHTGLVRFGARDYDAAIGRWMTKDSNGFAGRSSNLYAYADSDPVNLMDSKGKAVTSGGLCLAALTAAFAGSYGGAAAGCASACWGSCDFGGCFSECLGNPADILGNSASSESGRAGWSLTALLCVPHLIDVYFPDPPQPPPDPNPADQQPVDPGYREAA